MRVHRGPLEPNERGHLAANGTENQGKSSLAKIGSSGVAALAAVVWIGGAAAITSPNCTPVGGGNLCVLDPSAASALGLSGGSKLTVSNNIVVDSSSGSAAQLTGASTVTAGAIGGPGGFVAIGGSSFTPTPVTVAAQADPYAASPEPPHSCSGGSSLLATSAKTASPGTYTSLGAMTGGNLTLLPGNYTITQQFTNMGNGVVTGTGVTLYFCPGAGIALTGSSSTTLSAPGGSSGFVIFFDRTNTAQITTVDVTTNITGVIYAKSGTVAAINLNVTGDVVADTFRIRSGGVVTITGGPAPVPKVFLGYADNYFTHGNPAGLPWIGMSNTLVLGCGVNPNGGGAATNVCPKEPTNTSIDSYDARCDPDRQRGDDFACGDRSERADRLVFLQPVARSEHLGPARAGRSS